MQQPSVTRSALLSDLQRIGVALSDTLMVHASVRSVGRVLGGVNALVESLLGALGPTGTLVAYTDWEAGVTDEEWADSRLRDEIPAFDKRTARSRRDHGILPEVIRAWPGAIRSDNPGASMAAIGDRASWLCADHPLQYGYGTASPLGKLVAIGGKVLLLGAPFDTLTLLHHSEHEARIPGKRIVKSDYPLLVDGERRWVPFEEFDTSRAVIEQLDDVDYFGDIAAAYLGSGQGRTGTIGLARSFLFDARGIHEFAVAWLEQRFGS